MDYREIDFLPQKSNERINKAMLVFDPKVLFRILAFALHMIGAKRKSIAELINMPEESVKTTVRVVLRDGFPAFLDRRKSESPFIPKVSLTAKKIGVPVRMPPRRPIRGPAPQTASNERLTPGRGGRGRIGPLLDGPCPAVNLDTPSEPPNSGAHGVRCSPEFQSRKPWACNELTVANCPI